MTGQELVTAVQYGAPIVVLVVNNGMYGTIRMHQERHYPGRVSRHGSRQSRLRGARRGVRRASASGSSGRRTSRPRSTGARRRRGRGDGAACRPRGDHAEGDDLPDPRAGARTARDDGCGRCGARSALLARPRRSRTSPTRRGERAAARLRLPSWSTSWRELVAGHYVALGALRLRNTRAGSRWSAAPSAGRRQGDGLPHRCARRGRSEHQAAAGGLLRDATGPDAGRDLGSALWFRAAKIEASAWRLHRRDRDRLTTRVAARRYNAAITWLDEPLRGAAEGRSQAGRCSSRI